MKRFRKEPLIMIVLFLAMMILPFKNAYAASYDVSRYDATYEVQKNGDVMVTEDITYDFIGHYNGVYRDLDPDGTDGITDVSVSILRGSGEDKLSMTGEGMGSEGSFEFFKRSNGLMRLKIFEQSDSEFKTFRLKYTLKNLAIRYNDIGTLNRKIIDRNWDVPLNNVTAKIIIPEGAKKEDLRIFSHGDLTGYDEIVDARTYNVTISRVDSGDSVETLAIFPKDLIADSTNYVNEERLPTILKEEAVNAEKANAARAQAKADYEKMLAEQARRAKIKDLGKKLTPLFGAVSALCLGFIGFVSKKYSRERKPNFVGDYYRELPGDYTPAEMSYLMFDRSIQSKDLMATLLDLARKDLIKIEPYKTGKKGLFSTKEDTDYRISENRNYSGSWQLKPHEEFVFNWFTKDLATDGEVTLDEVEKILKTQSNAETFQSDYGRFKTLARSEGVKQKFFEKNDTKGLGLFYLIALLFLGAGLFMVVYFENLIGILSMALAGILMVVTSVMFAKKRYTQYGADQHAMWDAFRRFLLNFSKLDKAEIPALTIWNHYLVYATALGVAKEVMDQLPEVYSGEELQTAATGGVLMPIYRTNSYVNFDRSVSSLVRTSERTIEIANSRSSSSGGFGGGFSGGSSGGSGGGGGGGAF